MSYPAKLPVEGRIEIETVAKQRWNLPSDKELAIKYRISLARIQQIMAQVRERLMIEKRLGSTCNQQAQITDMPEGSPHATP